MTRTETDRPLNPNTTLYETISHLPSTGGRVSDNICILVVNGISKVVLLNIFDSWLIDSAA